MKRLLMIIVTVSMLAHGAQSGNDLFQKALVQERTEGNLAEAVKLYESIVEEHASDRKLVAKALLQMGQCHEKLGKDGARKAYQRIISEFTDQPEVATEARTRLAALRKPGAGEGPAGLTVRQVWAGPGVGSNGGLSPDGRYLFFTDWETGDLAVRDLTTGKNRHLTNKGSWEDSPNEHAGWSVVSPDGKQIAYVWCNKDEVYELHIVRLDGSGRRLLLRCEKKDYLWPVGWSPDGNRILVGFARNYLSEEPSTFELGFLSLKDGSMQVVEWHILAADDASSAERLSPDGRYVVYAQLATGNSERLDIFLLSVDGGRESPLVQHPADDRHPVWTPDGKKVLFASDRTGDMGFWSIDVADGKPQGLPKLVKADIGQLDRTIGLTSNGSLYYVLNTGMQDVYTAEFDPAAGRIEGTPKRLASRYAGTNMGPGWSPDGQYLAYHSQRGRRMYAPGSLVIVIQTLKTGEEREISTGLIQSAPVRWFPDGQSLLVSAYRSRKKDAIDFYRIDVQSGEASLIRRSEGGSSYGGPEVSPDGKTIFFAGSERKDSKIARKSLMAYHIETGQEEEIHRLGEGVRSQSVFVSPDGLQLAFVEYDGRSYAVKVIPAGGGQARELLRRPERIDRGGGLTWMPDGRHLLVSHHTGEPGGMTELLRVPVTGGDAQKVGLAMEDIRFMDVHPDGRQIAFRSGQYREWAREIWVMEDFLPAPPAAE